MIAPSDGIMGFKKPDCSVNICCLCDVFFCSFVVIIWRGLSLSLSPTNSIIFFFMTIDQFPISIQPPRIFKN